MSLAGPTTAILWTRPSPEMAGAGLEPTSAHAARGAAPAVYAGTRLDVVPATLVRLPESLSSPANSGSMVSGTVELVIDELGAVEHVKLVAHGDYAEIQRMASAWRRAEFRPATRAGLPVKFRVSLPVRPTP